MSLIQKLLKAVLPRRIWNKIEAESRSWMVRCSCGYERSVWAIGGIRWKARGKPRRRLTCPICREVQWHEVYKT